MDKWVGGWMDGYMVAGMRKTSRNVQPENVKSHLVSTALSWCAEITFF